ncbi:MAG: hypothetical protein Q8P33_03210 [bacterium]|nr:hypothetical protein [bacterium]
MPSHTDTALALLQNAKRVAIYPCATNNTDALAAGIALAHAVAEHGTTVSVTLDDDPDAATAVPDFFKAGSFTKTPVTTQSELLIEVPTKATPVQSVSYERTADKLLIHITPRSGQINPNQVSARTNIQTSGDVLVVVGARSLRELGPRFTGAAEQFYQKPTIALGYHPDAEPFATVQLSDPSARSCCAIAYDLIKAMMATISPQIATALLTGIFTMSQSFQRAMTSPREFDLAATLLELGADRHAVISHLYKTKPLPTLKLWGRVLAKLEADPHEQVWRAEITQTDFTDTKTTPDTLLEVMHDVLAQTSRAQLIAVAYQRDTTTSGVLIATTRSAVRDRFIDYARSMASISTKTNQSITALYLPLPLAQTTALVSQIGEQIVQPGYTDPTHAQRTQPVDQTRISTIRRTQKSQPATAKKAV